jgi:hypothetical protein
MPQIPLPDPFDGVPYLDEPDFSDMWGYLPAQRQDEPEEEDLTDEQRRDAGFQGESYQGPRLGGFQEPGNEPALPRADNKSGKGLYLLGETEYSITDGPGSELCVYSGWPRRHVRVGRHCPHGMLERLKRAQEEANDASEGTGELGRNGSEGHQ